MVLMKIVRAGKVLQQTFEHVAMASRIRARTQQLQPRLLSQEDQGRVTRREWQQEQTG